MNSLTSVAAKHWYLLLFLLVPVAAEGEEWMLYFGRPHRAKFYIDTASIVVNGDRVRAWNKMEGENGDGNISLLEIDCAERRYTYHAMVPLASSRNYAKDMENFSSMMKIWEGPPQVWAYLDPTDLQEAEYKAWCSRK